MTLEWPRDLLQRGNSEEGHIVSEAKAKATGHVAYGSKVRNLGERFPAM